MPDAYQKCIEDSRESAARIEAERGSLRARVAAAIGWSVADAGSFSLQTLRDLLPSGHPLRAEISWIVATDRVVTTGGGRP